MITLTPEEREQVAQILAQVMRKEMRSPTLNREPFPANVTIPMLFDHSRIQQFRDWKLEHVEAAADGTPAEVMRRIAQGDAFCAALFAEIAVRAQRELERRRVMAACANSPSVDG